jgi:hypothetical protein
MVCGADRGIARVIRAITRVQATLPCANTTTVPMTGRKPRTLELLAFGEFCRFDTSAFFLGNKASDNVREGG